MAKYGSNSVFVLVDGYDISGDTFEATLNKSVALEETHGFGDSWVERTSTAIKSGSVEHRTFYDDAALASNDALVSSNGSSRVMLVGLAGNTQGRKCAGMTGVQAQYSRLPARGELTKVSANYSTTGEIDEPNIVQILAAQTSGGAGSSGALDNTASSANGGAAYLQITGLTLGGYTSVSIVLQHSSDNGVGDPFVQIGSAFANATTTGAQRVRIADGTTVKRYLRAFVTWNGAGSGQSVTYCVAFARN